MGWFRRRKRVAETAQVVAAGGDAAHDQAAIIAAALGNGPQGEPRVFTGTTDNASIQVVTFGATDDAEAIAMAESMLGMDLDGDGRVASGAAAGVWPPGAAAENRVGELERLASLRDRGVLSEEEFLAEKRRLLGT